MVVRDSSIQVTQAAGKQWHADISKDSTTSNKQLAHSLP
jgi:hypothetical protein